MTTKVLHRRYVALALTAGLAALSACSPGAASSGRVITVFAAASLTESFTTIAVDFERSRQVRVALVFGPSTELGRQIAAGADADVYAAASVSSLHTVTGRMAGPPTVFARNRLQLIVPKGNPGRLTNLRDLGPPTKFVQCAVQVPCGETTQRLLARFDLADRARPVSYERDVKAVLAKVSLGEVDAGFVYFTDLHAAARGSASSKISGVHTPDVPEAFTDYPIVAVAGKGADATAQAFVDYVLSAPGQAVLTDAGFTAA